MYVLSHFSRRFSAYFLYITYVCILFCLSLQELNTSHSCKVFANKPLLRCTGSFLLCPSLRKLHWGFNISFRRDVHLLGQLGLSVGGCSRAKHSPLRKLTSQLSHAKANCVVPNGETQQVPAQVRPDPLNLNTGQLN